MSRSDIVWYGRAGVWLGVGLLLLMAFTGAQVEAVSVFAVIATIVGLVFLFYAIPWRAASPRNETSAGGEVDV